MDCFICSLIQGCFLHLSFIWAKNVWLKMISGHLDFAKWITSTEGHNNNSSPHKHFTSLSQTSISLFQLLGCETVRISWHYIIRGEKAEHFFLFQRRGWKVIGGEQSRDLRLIYLAHKPARPCSDRLLKWYRHTDREERKSLTAQLGSPTGEMWSSTPSKGMQAPYSQRALSFIQLSLSLFNAHPHSHRFS